jgi:hypothetical protein
VLGLAALVFAAASVNASPSTTSVSPWWERITWTFSGDGAQQSCKFESSLDGRTTCDREDESGPTISGGSGSAGSYTKITVERRFTPAGRPDRVSLQSGDTMLGGQIIALAIGTDGAVHSCRIIGASGDVQPPYGCREARAERFEASAGRETPEVRQAFMTVVVYGHEEYLA